MIRLKVKCFFALILMLLVSNFRLIAKNTKNEIVQGSHYQNTNTGKDFLNILNKTFAYNLKEPTGTKKMLNPLIPFGAMTGKPTKSQLKKYLDSYKSVGIDQFQIYARSGLELEYMGDEWLDVCEYIIEYASENAISVWLYDEYNWPSGSCKGQVVRQDENFAAKKIVVWRNSVTLGKHNYFWEVTSVPLYPDILNPKAVESFISLTHEKYYKRFSKYFGTVIKGFFTDEPSPMYAAGHKTSGSLLELIYWDGLEYEYNQYTNQDFRVDVESYLKGNTPPNLWEDYFYLLGQRFKTSFFDPIREWCNQHNVLFTGHLMDESITSKALLAMGNPMSVINSFSLPGIDEIYTWTNTESIEWITMKMVEDAAINIGNGASAELFALGPSDMTLSKRRQMIWLSALHGINHYFFSLASLDARANIEKPDYYNPITVIQPWFDATKELGEDAKKAALYAQKKGIQEIAIRYPQKLTASLFHSKEQSGYNLRGLIQNLVSCQWNPRLISEDESHISDYSAILTLTSNGIVEEKSGKKFEFLEELSSWLDNNIERTTIVESKGGKLLENVLIKNYDDGTVCVVSLLDNPLGDVVLKRAGSKPVIFELPANGVFTYTSGQYISKYNNVLNLSVEELLPYQLTSTNTIRAVFDETGIFEFTLSENIEDLSFAVRNYNDTVRVKLDGIELSTTVSCQFLPEGLKELYLESGKISLQAGKHTLALITESLDYPYFPSAFISGNFGKNEGNLLTRLPESISLSGYRRQGLKEYVGSISFTQKIALNKFEYLSIDTQGLVTEVFINGKSIGKKAWAPFRWKIPQQYKNKKVVLGIRIWTSIGPLFGEYPQEAGKEGSWLKRFAPK
jgi:hypothetical protein